MIFAANRCRDRSPNIYIADEVSEVAEILNPRLGDVAMVVADGATFLWKLQDSDLAPDGFSVIQSNACEYVWVWAWSEAGLSVTLFGADSSGQAMSTENINEALSVARGNVFFPPGTYLIDDNLEITRSNFDISGYGATVIQTVSGKDGIGNYTNLFLRRVNIYGLQFNCAANVIGNAAYYWRNIAESMLTSIKTSMQSNFATDGFMYGIKMWGENAIGGPWYNEINQPSILTHQHANAIGIDSNADAEGYGANSTKVIGGSVQALGGTGIRIDRCNNFVCDAVKCEGANTNTGYGIRIASQLGGNVIMGCRFEDLNVNIVLGVGSHHNWIGANNHNSAATAVIQNFGDLRTNVILESEIPEWNEARFANLDVFGTDTSGLTDHTVFRGGVIDTRYWDHIAKGFNVVTGGYDYEITNPTFKGDILINVINSGLFRTSTIAPLTSAGALVMQDGFVRFQRAAAGSAIWTGYTSGENNSRVSVFNDGEHRFSDGTNADDVGFIRLSAGVLKITDAGAGLGIVRAGGLSVTLQSFANNGAALAGGLVANDFYQVTGTDPRQVAVVI